MPIPGPVCLSVDCFGCEQKTGQSLAEVQLLPLMTC